MRTTIGKNSHRGNTFIRLHYSCVIQDEHFAVIHDRLKSKTASLMSTNENKNNCDIEHHNITKKANVGKKRKLIVKDDGSTSEAGTEERSDEDKSVAGDDEEYAIQKVKGDNSKKKRRIKEDDEEDSVKKDH